MHMHIKMTTALSAYACAPFQLQKATGSILHTSPRSRSNMVASSSAWFNLHVPGKLPAKKLLGTHRNTTDYDENHIAGSGSPRSARIFTSNA